VTRDVVRRVQPATHPRAHETLRDVAQFLAWCHLQGLEVGIETSSGYARSSRALPIRDVLPRRGLSPIEPRPDRRAGDRVGGHSSYVHGSTAAQAAPKQAPFMALAPGAVGVCWVAVSQRGGAVDLLGSEPTRAARLLRGFACHGCSVRRVRRCATA